MTLMELNLVAQIQFLLGCTGHWLTIKINKLRSHILEHQDQQRAWFIRLQSRKTVTFSHKLVQNLEEDSYSEMTSLDTNTTSWSNNASTIYMPHLLTQVWALLENKNMKSMNQRYTTINPRLLMRISSKTGCNYQYRSKKISSIITAGAHSNFTKSSQK